MKRTVTLLALLAALCCLLTVSAAAADAPTSGTCGENLTWTLDGEGTLTISGTGAMEEYEWRSDVPWYQSRDSIKTVVIENGAASISDYAFYICTNLVSVTVPDSVTVIGKNAFYNCRSLTSVTFAGECQLATIGKSAFDRCESLTDVSITDMDAWCRIDFGDSSANPMCCAQNIRLNGSKIASVTVPEGVTELKYTFYGFKNLIRVTLPKSLTDIGEETFYNCTSLTNLTIPDGVTAIGDSACFRCTSLSSVTIPASVTTIGSSAFYDCTSLTSVTIPEGVTSIGSSAFWNCTSLTGITIPDGVTAIGSSAFHGCSSLTGITIPEGVTSIGDSAFWRCNRLTITLPESVTSIGEDAFYSCSSLVSVNIPQSVTSIGASAFSGCDALADVSITDLEAWFQIEFARENASPFYYAKNLYLNGQLVESLEIPGSVSVIPAGLFRSATCLKRVSIPRSLAGVAANAFENCTNITEVFYEGSESEWANLPISSGNDPLKNAPNIYFNSTLDDYYCRISVQVSSGGRVTVDHAAARAGDTVTVTAAPYQGYELSAICVDGAAIEGNTFVVTRNHVVSAVFTRLPVTGGTEDFRLEGLSVRTAAGEALQELPQGSLLVTVAVRHLNENGSGTILLAQYDALGRYRGLMWLTLDEMPQGMTLRVTLPVDNSSGEIANLKVFVVEDLSSPLPVGTPVSFGQV